MSAFTDSLIKAIQDKVGAAELENIRLGLQQLEAAASIVNQWMDGGNTENIANANFLGGGGANTIERDGYHSWNASLTATLETIRLETDGDAFFGSDLSSPNTTVFCIFANDQTYNGESMGAGDVLFGSNTAGYANILWDASAKQLRFRGGTTAFVYISTEGKLSFPGTTTDISIYQENDDLIIETPSNGNVVLKNSNTGLMRIAAYGTDGLLTLAAAQTGIEEGAVLFLYSKDYATAASQAAATISFGTDASHDSKAGRFAVFDNKNSVYRLWVNASGAFIGDDANANMTTGLTINQGAADDEILSLKSSDVAHGMTDLAETDTFFHITKEFGAPASGGAQLSGYTEDEVAVRITCRYTNDDTGKATSANGAFEVNASKKSGTGVGAMGANSNIAAFRANGTARFILDADGDSHQDVGTAWTNFDTHNDTELLTQLSVQVSREDDPIRRELGSFLNQNRKRLEELKLVTFNEDGHHFVNMSRLTMLLVGAVRQVSNRLDRFERVVLAMGASPELLKG